MIFNRTLFFGGCMIFLTAISAPLVVKDETTLLLWIGVAIALLGLIAGTMGFFYKNNG